MATLEQATKATFHTQENAITIWANDEIYVLNLDDTECCTLVCEIACTLVGTNDPVHALRTLADAQ